MSQLPLPIDWSERGETGSLLMTAANADAITLLRNWPRWPGPATLLVGPPKSGRSLIGRLFATESGGAVLDDADEADETQLFNLWNAARDSGRPLLLIAREAPPLWAVSLPDLRTRLATAAVARPAPASFSENHLRADDHHGENDDQPDRATEVHACQCAGGVASSSGSPVSHAIAVSGSRSARPSNRSSHSRKCRPASSKACGSISEGCSGAWRVLMPRCCAPILKDF